MKTKCQQCGKQSLTAFCDKCAPPDPAKFKEKIKQAPYTGLAQKNTTKRWKTSKGK